MLKWFEHLFVNIKDSWLTISPQHISYIVYPKYSIYLYLSNKLCYIFLSIQRILDITFLSLLYYNK